MSTSTQLEQAIDRATAAGLAVTVITIHPPDGYDEADVEEAYAAAAKPPTKEEQAAASSPAPAPAPAGDGGAALEELKKKLADAEGRAHQANAQIADLQKHLSAAASGDASAALAQANNRIAELEQQLSAAQQAAQQAGSGNGSGGVDPGATLASYESYPVSVLGLSEKAQKGVDKCECQTVGDVRQALLSGRLAEKGKGNGNLPRAEIIEVGNKLLGQVPSAEPPPAQAGGGGARDGVPPGVTPPPWDRLLTAAYKKEQAAIQQRQSIEQAMTALSQLRSQQLTPDIQTQIDQWEQAKNNADKMMAMYEGQVATLLFTSGLPYDLKQVRSVNGALEAAGLHHLVNEAPQPEGVPAGASS